VEVAQLPESLETGKLPRAKTNSAVTSLSRWESLEEEERRMS